MTASAKSGFFLEESVFFPEDQKQFLLKETDITQRHAVAINQKEVGFYYQEETQTGAKAYNPCVGKILPVFRKVVNFGGLPNTSSKSVDHGISLTDSGFFLKAYAAAKNPSAKEYITFSYPILSISNSKITINTSSDLSNYSCCVVIVEYTK